MMNCLFLQYFVCSGVMSCTRNNRSVKANAVYSRFSPSYALVGGSDVL